MRQALAVLFLALPLPPLAAQEYAGSTVTVKVGRLAHVPVIIDADEVEYAVLGEALDGFREFDANAKKLRIRVIGYEPGTGYVVVSGVKGGKLVPLAVVTVKVVAGPVPPPPPNPDPPTPPKPPDPPPLDPLAKALKDAAAADGWPAAKLAALATGFKVAADRVSSRETLADMVAVARAALKESSPDPTPATVRAVLAKELSVLDGPDRAATDDDKAKVKALFLKLGTALSEAAK